ncbi:inositol monophosphatase family protein [Cumulibacter soli]|uniref:inositol monophosphatase family protein n=1 Tax=Cumulibacter soli TaxID=2546344 RepID=UPI001068C761|nr:inositol monophosphatase family protein [Cumulibacter soli]
MTAEYTDDIRLAHVIADQLDALTLARFTSMDFTVESKPDLTPVTDADRDAESLARALLSRHRGRDAVLGEEGGESGHSSRKWIIDPIDGTKNFVRGVPVWATLIGLLDGDEVVAGLVSAPALRRRWWASKGAGAWTGRSLSQGKRICVSKVDEIADASLSYSSLNGWADRDQFEQFLRLMVSCWRTRGYGDFWSYMLLAEGAVDIAAEPDLELWDLAALIPIVREAGGQFTGVSGGDPLVEKCALATNGKLHKAALESLRLERSPSSPPPETTPYL